MADYIDNNCFRGNLLCNLIFNPYAQGCNNLGKVVSHYEVINNRVYQITNRRRIQCFLAAVILLIPIVNSIAYYIFYRIQLLKFLRNQEVKLQFVGTTIAIIFAKKLLKQARENLEHQRREREKDLKLPTPSLMGRVRKSISHTFSKGILFLQRNGAIIRRMTGGIEVTSALASVGSLGLTIRALRERNWRSAGFNLYMTVGNAFNGIVHTLFTRDQRAFMRANQI